MSKNSQKKRERVERDGAKEGKDDRTAEEDEKSVRK